MTLKIIEYLWRINIFLKIKNQKSGTNEDNILDKFIIGIKSDGIYTFNREHNEIIEYKYETIMYTGEFQKINL